MYLSELVIIIFQPGILISVYNIRIILYIPENKVLFKKEGGADLHSTEGGRGSFVGVLTPTHTHTHTHMCLIMLCFLIVFTVRCYGRRRNYTSTNTALQFN